MMNVWMKRSLHEPRKDQSILALSPEHGPLVLHWWPDDGGWHCGGGRGSDFTHWSHIPEEPE